MSALPACKLVFFIGSAVLVPEPFSHRTRGAISGSIAAFMGRHLIKISEVSQHFFSGM